MASSNGLASVDPWSFRQSFNNLDSWLLPDPFSHDSDVLSKALHRSITDPLSPSPFFDSSSAVSAAAVSAAAVSAAAVSDHSPPQTISTVSFGSDPDISAVVVSGGGAKRKRGGLGVSGVKPPKRRSRVSTKKSQTTFITADAANFRQMVQQVTGAKFTGIFAPVVKPEPHRLATKLPPPSGAFDRSSAVPTLDTSSFLSNHQQENMVISAPDGGGGSAVELDSYPSFPTLESWKVM